MKENVSGCFFFWTQCTEFLYFEGTGRTDGQTADRQTDKRLMRPIARTA